jgi:aryl sulfotransferase
MSAIVWLASYPKSGNTWVRILLANYLSGEDQPVDINELGKVSMMASARRVFDEWCGVEASALDQDVIDRLRAEVYRRLAADSPRDLFIKVHDAWSADDHGQAMFPPDVTKAVVYVVRNPLDVAVSAAHHWHLDAEQAVGRVCDAAYCSARTNSRLPDQLRQFVGCWSGHARSWLDQSGLRAHVVRYEDLRRNPEQALTGIVGACGLTCDPERVRVATAFSDFGELQRQERAHGFRERPRTARGAFFRRGEVGAWRDELPAPLADRLVETHREMMTRFGYLEEAV